MTTESKTRISSQTRVNLVSTPVIKDIPKKIQNKQMNNTGGNARQKENKFYIAPKLYPDIKRALVERGWIESTSKNAKANLKFEYRANDTGNQHQGTMLNHNSGEVHLTHKACLCGTLDDCQIFSSVWLEGKIEIRNYAEHKLDSYFPRCYILTTPTTHLPFFEDYTMNAAEGYLKKFAKAYTKDPKDAKT